MDWNIRRSTLKIAARNRITAPQGVAKAALSCDQRGCETVFIQQHERCVMENRHAPLHPTSGERERERSHAWVGEVMKRSMMFPFRRPMTLSRFPFPSGRTLMTHLFAYVCKLLRKHEVRCTVKSCKIFTQRLNFIPK